MKIKTKQCRTCEEVKQIDCFYFNCEAKDGRNGACSDCCRKKNIKWYRENADIYKKRYEDKKNTENYKQSHRKAVRKNINENPLKQAARVIARKLNLPKEGNCSICNDYKILEKHHPDYSKPEDVVSICVSCHKDIHKKYKKEDLS
jgi:hypothetical protein